MNLLSSYIQTSFQVEAENFAEGKSAINTTHMKYQYTVRTPYLNSSQRQSELYFLLELLYSHEVDGVELLFGAFWGNDYRNWTPVFVYINEIVAEIALAESTQAGTFEEDDFTVIVNKYNAEILFCHEYNIHLSYNEENKFVNSLVAHWKNISFELIKSTSA